MNSIPDPDGLPDDAALVGPVDREALAEVGREGTVEAGVGRVDGHPAGGGGHVHVMSVCWCYGFQQAVDFEDNMLGRLHRRRSKNY